jgi:F0F1-type ATP synthase membrane subunit b/b'
MKGILEFFVQYQAILTALISLIHAIHLLKVLLQIRDKLKEVDINKQTSDDNDAYLNRQLEKFKSEVRERLTNLEKEIEDGLDEVTESVTSMEHKVEGEHKAFHQTLHNINITLTKFDGTLTHLNDNLKSSKEQLNKMVDRVFTEFSEHKEDIRDQIREFKNKQH